MSRIRHVCALGSSFAAGPGLRPVAAARAGRSRVNYPSLVAEALGARLTDLTVAGASTDTVLYRPQRCGWKTFPPQSTVIPADCDVVTVTVGGNDLGYIGALADAAAAGALRTSPLTAWLGERRAARTGPTDSLDDLDRVTAGLVRIIDTARQRAPGAQVVLVDYLTVLGDRTVPGPDLPLAATEVDRLRRTAHHLEEVFLAASGASGADLVQASGLSRDHALGDPEPWVAGARPDPHDGAAPFHPNARGMRAVADEVLRLLRGRGTLALPATAD